MSRRLLIIWILLNVGSICAMLGIFWAETTEEMKIHGIMPTNCCPQLRAQDHKIGEVLRKPENAVLIGKDTPISFSDRRRSTDLKWIKLCKSNEGFNSPSCGLKRAPMIRTQAWPSFVHQVCFWPRLRN